jgi:hypothetical protein
MEEDEAFQEFLAAADQSVRERMMSAGWATGSAESEAGVALRLTPKGLESLKRMAALLEELGDELPIEQISALYQIIKAQGRR